MVEAAEPGRTEAALAQYPTLDGEVIDPSPETEVDIIPRRGPFAPEERAQVARWIGQGMSRNEIARRTGRGVATITRIAQSEGLTFNQADMMRPAQEAKALDLRARRLQLAERLLDDAHRLREQLWKPHMIYFVDYKNGRVLKQKTKEPPPQDKRNLMTAIGIAVDKVAELERLEAPQEGRQAIIMLVDTLRAREAHAIHNELEGK